MTKRIDHAAEARRLLDVADLRPSANWEAETGERKADVLAAAQVQAALALVEQQRIANLIALSVQSDAMEARAQADRALYARMPDKTIYGVALPLRPDIAAALGTEVQP